MLLKKITVTSISIIFLLFITACLVYANPKEIIRVGYVHNYGTIYSDGRKISGYGYDYLMQISKYSDLTFEFVQVDWNEGLKMLEEGKIDLFGPFSKTAAHKNQYIYSKRPFGIAEYIISSNNEKANLYKGIQSLDGKKIGMPNAEYFKKILNKFMEKNAINLEIIYSDISQHVNGINNNLYDFCLSSNLFFNPNLTKVITVHKTPFYYITSLNNTDLMNKIDASMTRIVTKQPLFENRLYLKYFYDRMENISLPDAKALESLRALGPIKVYYQDNHVAIQDTNDSGEAVGISIAVMKLLAERYRLNFHFKECDDEHNSLKRYVSICSISNIEEDVSAHSIPYFAFPLISIDRNDEHDGDEYVGILRYKFLDVAQIKRDIAPKKIKLYDDFFVLWQDFLDHKLGAVITTELAEGLLHNLRETAEFTVSPSPYIMQLRLSISPLLRQYVFLFNEMILKLSDSEKSEIIMSQLAKFYKSRSFFDIIMERPLLSFSILAGILTFLLIMIILGLRKQKLLLNNIVTQDQVTGLKTEYSFIQEVQDILVQEYADQISQKKNLVKEEQSKPKKFSIISIDIDNFQYINESYGYNKGSFFLKAFGKSIVEACPQGAIVCRKFSDNFIIFQETTDLEGHFKELFFNTIQERFLKYSKKQMQLHMSAGQYNIKSYTEDLSYMIECASSARQYLKSDFGNTFSIFSQSMRKEKDLKSKITRTMQEALYNKDFQVYYQPKINMHNKSLIGAEALVRWIVNGRIIYSPDEFIPIFEKNGFIDQLDMYVLNKVCMFIKENIDILKNITISVNLSQATLFRTGIVNCIRKIVLAHDIPMSSLEFEITERAVTTNFELLKKRIAQLKDYGFQVSMDDFGTESSCLSRLKDIDIDTLKLDKSFLDLDTETQKGIKIIQKILEMAHTLGIQTVVEGIEDKKEEDLLNSLGCEIAQGYLYSKPIPKDSFIDYVTNPLEQLKNKS